MIIKRYLVKDMNEAMIRIRYELGSDAIIVSKRWVRQKGITKFFKKKVLEVTAAADQSKMKKNTRIHNEQEVETTNNIPPIEEKSHDGFEKELQELKELVYKLVENKEKEEEISPDIVDENFIAVLREMDLDDKVIEDFIGYCKERDILLSDLNNDVLYKYFQKQVDSKVNLQPEMKEKVWVFVGPTGVGKTTTIAKIAARELVHHRKKVGLITLDTYRIGAVEQLKTYADILGIPLKTVVTKEELIRAMEELEDCDRILVDSTGRSSFNHKKIEEMKDFLQQIKRKRIFLAVNINTRKKDLKTILNSYEEVGYDCIILTKTDETRSYGSILNISYYTDKPISYITTGQNVPDDLEKASKERLFRYIWGEVQI